MRVVPHDKYVLTLGTWNPFLNQTLKSELFFSGCRTLSGSDIRLETSSDADVKVWVNCSESEVCLLFNNYKFNFVFYLTE